METCTAERYRQYLETFTVPDPAQREALQRGEVGLILLPESQFRYDRSLGYCFATAAKVEEGTDRRLLFIRIDSWDPKYRKSAAAGAIDFCIPMAYEGASDRERLTWTIGLGGAWSDSRQEAIVVLDSSWRQWVQSFCEGLAFSNPTAQSAAFMSFGQVDWNSIREFCE